MGRQSSWQIVPSRMDAMMKEARPDQLKQLVQAFLLMKRMDIATLERAFVGR